MRYLTLTLLLACAANLNLTAQALSPVCDIQARIIISVCFDPPGCLILNPKIENGYLPYTYLWDTGSSNPSIGYGPNVPNVCHTVTITDARGCVAVASDSTTFELLASNLAAPDTFWVGSTPVDIDVSLNDTSDLVEFLLVQPPLHGALTLSSDGSGQYTPEGTWCGPDYFRYAARINCKYTQMITSVILKENCANVVVTKSDCNASCDGEAYFYHNNLLPEPLTLQWSNGEQGFQAQQLCQGLAQVTVTDGLGNPHIYSVEIPGTLLEAGIGGPTEVCIGSLKMDAQVSLEGEVGPVTYLWQGTTLSAQGWVQDHLSTSTYYSDSLYSYSLTVQSELGCIDTAFHQTYVHANPFITGLPQNLLLDYSPDTLRLSPIVSRGAAPFTFSWTGPQGVFSDQPSLVWPVDQHFSGLYRLKVVDQNGCYDIRTANVTIRDSVTSIVNISNPNYAICANTDYRLSFGMQGGWVEPEVVLWTGPNNFSSTELNPVLENVQPGMTGMYYLALTYGDQVVKDSALFTFSTNSAQVLSNEMIAPTTCIAPTDGSLTLNIDAPGPFSVSASWGGSNTSYPASPFTIPNIRPSNVTHTLTIRTGNSDGCRVVLPVKVPYPDSISFQFTTACNETGGAVELIAAPPANRMVWHVPGYSSNPDTIFHIENVPPGAYSARIWGATGCQYQNVPFTVEPHLNFDVAVNQQPDCESSDGSLSVIWNELPPTPLTYAWNNGADTPTNEQLSRGWYSVTVSDNIGCSNHKNAYLPADQVCTPSVSGRAFVNTDCICAADSNYFAYSNLRVCATNGSYTDCTYTDYTGGYILALSDPGPYELNIYPTQPYLEQNCTPYTFNINTNNEQLSGQNIFLCGQAVVDAELTEYCGVARPGFPYKASFRVRNIGSLILDSLTLSAVISPLIQVSELIPPPSSFDPVTNEVTWRINADLTWQAYTDFVVEGVVNGALGDTVIHHGAVSINATDIYLENNRFDCYSIVRGSYDPNDKSVTPMGRGENGAILPNDSSLAYTIRFQNTGTDTAFTVVIRDTLDAAVFDLNSVQAVIASHPYRLDVEGEHILVFTFENIMLPDSGWSQQASQGYVVFNIALLEGLPLGTAISNSAAIYFDYNDPVITNVTLNTLTPTQEQRLPEALSWQLFPNPSAGNVTTILSLSKPVRNLSFSLYNQQGICLMRQRQVSGLTPGDYAFSFDFSDWPSGIYLLQLQTELGYATHKLILQH